MNPFVLAGLQTATTLTGSAVLALAVLMEAADAETAWTAAHVDEAWQADQWGTDAEAAQRLSARKAEFLAAALFMRLSAH
jgi:chaperone required for assembly of F1-ATPase